MTKRSKKTNVKKALKETAEFVFGATLMAAIGIWWFAIYASAVGHPWHPFR